jgi:OOP family OmpA-OmpF porin
LNLFALIFLFINKNFLLKCSILQQFKLELLIFTCDIFIADLKFIIMKKSLALQFILTFTFLNILQLNAQVNTVTDDSDWSSQQATLKNTSEADFIIRIGDVDNLGFGWPEGFDPFCGRMTESHSFPWEARAEDLPGLDRILLSSKFSPNAEFPCGGDGYSGSYDPILTKPVTWTLPTTILKGAEIKNAYLQIFIDDFQAPSFCSKFQIFVNGTRFAEGEKLLNAIDQTGPVGKLLTIPLPEEFYNALVTKNNFSIKIDESTGAADGFAVDFIRLLVNRNKENTCKGDIIGRVLEKSNEIPISNAIVWLADNRNTTSKTNGEFELKNIPTGYEIISASSPGFADGYATADIGQGEFNPEVIIYLEKGSTAAQFNNKKIIVGETINLNNIMFDQGKAELKNESKTELDKVVAFMQANTNAEIELSGHTSSEGEANYNRSLSYKRVKACKDYILSLGIDAGRIIAIGFGPDRPVAPNDSEANRAKNRRVEMRLVKL